MGDAHNLAYTKVYDAIKALVGSGKLTMDNISVLVISAMEAVESTAEFASGSGAVKAEKASQLVIEVLHKLADEKLVKASIIDPFTSAFTVLSPLIFSTIVAASKGQININKKDDGTPATGGCCVVM